jgi:hypothetical protein
MADLKHVTRRNFLVAEAMLLGTPMSLAVEAVSTTAVEHPELDMHEIRTWAEWQGDGGRPQNQPVGAHLPQASLGDGFR